MSLTTFGIAAAIIMLASALVLLGMKIWQRLKKGEDERALLRQTLDDMSRSMQEMDESMAMLAEQLLAQARIAAASGPAPTAAAVPAASGAAPAAASAAPAAVPAPPPLPAVLPIVPSHPVRRSRRADTLPDGIEPERPAPKAKKPFYKSFLGVLIGLALLAILGLGIIMVLTQHKGGSGSGKPHAGASDTADKVAEIASGSAASGSCGQCKPDEKTITPDIIGDDGKITWKWSGPCVGGDGCDKCKVPAKSCTTENDTSLALKCACVK